LISSVLPGAAVGVVAYGDVPFAQLFPEEEAAVAQAAEARRREFATTRACARTALHRLGFPAVPLPTGQGREPQWPATVVGSLTHCTGLRAAAVARRADIVSLGIDAEPHRPLPAGLLDRIGLPAERAAVTRRRDGICWDRLLFSAKESVYKAWFPLTRRRLAFSEAQIDLHPDPGSPTTGEVRAALLVPGPVHRGRSLTAVRGRYAIRHGLLVTGVWWAEDESPDRTPAAAHELPVKVPVLG
jgi:4'-phosphopantetheinyl transferase EntD